MIEGQRSFVRECMHLIFCLIVPDGGPNEMQKTNVGTLMFSPKDTLSVPLSFIGALIRHRHYQFQCIAAWYQSM